MGRLRSPPHCRKVFSTRLPIPAWVAFILAVSVSCVGCGERVHFGDVQVTDGEFSRFRDMIRSDARRAIGVPQIPATFGMHFSDDPSEADLVLLIESRPYRPGRQRWITTFTRSGDELLWKQDAIRVFGPMSTEGPDGTDYEYVSFLVVADGKDMSKLRVERAGYHGPRGEFAGTEQLAFEEVAPLIGEWIPKE